MSFELIQLKLTELARIIKEFKEQFEAGTSDSDHFISLNEIEKLWGNLNNQSEYMYSDMIRKLMSMVDERDIVRKKREYQEKGIRLRTDERAFREISTLQGKITYSRNILRPADAESMRRLIAFEHVKSIAPLDYCLGIANLPFKISAGLMLRCAYWTQNQCSYQAAEDILEKVYGIKVSDDAAWIANIAEELFPNAQHILDYFHLSENVYSYAKAKFHLDENEQYENAVNLYHYIKTNAHHIDYPVYMAKGYFIGSGAIESGNKVVLQKRLKQSGMCWNPKTAQYLLTLKSKRIWN